jgi:hypothetical protein
MVCASFEHIYSVYKGETPLRFFNTRKRKGCFREEAGHTDQNIHNPHE